MRHFFLVVAAMLTFGLTFASGQDPDGNVVKVNNELASFEVTVSDKDGGPVRDLTASDFRIFEDGIERPLDFFAPLKKEDDGRPLAIVFALDVSGSMTAEELARLRQAMQGFIDKLRG